MTYAARETSVHSGEPYELFAFQTADDAWFFTSSDTAQSYLGFEFMPETIVRTAINQSGEAKGGQVKLTLPLANPVALQFRSYVPDSPMSIVIYRTHGTDGEFVTTFTGRVLSAAFGDFAELTCMPENDLLKYNVPSAKFQTQCNHFLFGTGCGVSKTDFAVNGVVSHIDATGNVLTVAAFAGKPDGWFAAGYVEVGLQRRMIVAHAGNLVTLITPVPGLVVGAALVGYAGCMRDFHTCVAKFTNGPHFSGFQWIPIKNPFTTSFQ